jgi:hypothetical protein
MQQSDDNVIITPLVLHEIYDVVRAKVPKKFNPQKGHQDSDVSNEINQKIKTIVSFFIVHKMKGKIIYFQPNIPLLKYNNDVLSIQRKYFGTIIPSGKIFVYKGVGHCDIKHGLNGTILNITTFYSLDQWFADFSQISDLSMIKVITTW